MTWTTNDSELDNWGWGGGGGWGDPNMTGGVAIPTCHFEFDSTIGS